MADAKTIQTWRDGLAAMITVLLIMMMAVASAILVVAAGRWVMDDAFSGWGLLRACGTWLVSFILVNVWSLRLRSNLV